MRGRGESTSERRERADILRESEKQGPHTALGLLGIRVRVRRGLDGVCIRVCVRVVAVREAVVNEPPSLPPRLVRALLVELVLCLLELEGKGEREERRGGRKRTSRASE